MSVRKPLPISVWKLSISCTLWNISTALINFIMPLLILAKTGQSSDVGLAFAVEWSLLVLAFPFIGHWIDKFGAARVSKLANIARITAALAAIVAIFTLQGLAMLMVLVALAAVITFGTGVIDVAVDTMLPLIVEKGDLARSQSLYQGSEMFGYIVGPFLAAVLVNQVPLSVFFIFATGSFLICSYALSNVVMRSFERHHSDNPWQSIRRGFAIIKQTPALQCFALLNFFINLLMGYMLSISPVIITQGFEASQSLLGLLRGASGACGILALVVINRLSHRIETKSLGFVSWILLPLSCFAIAFSELQSMMLFFVLYCLLVVLLQMHNVFSRTERLAFIEQSDLGKVLSLFHGVGMAALPISGLILAGFAELSMMATTLSLIALLLAFTCLISYLVIYQQPQKRVDGAKT